MKLASLKYLILAFIFLSSPLAIAQDDQLATDNKMAAKEFIRSCTYGVLAGTLVGAATLAFTEQPGENINRVARGASLGLYAGILLGLYVVYVVPGQIEDSLEEDPNLLPPEVGDDEYTMNWGAFPLISERGIEGGGLSLEISLF